MNNTTIQRLVFRRNVWVLSLIFVWVCFLVATMPTRHQAQGAELNANSAAAKLMFDLTGADGQVSALAGEGDYVYAGGSFGTIGGVTANGVARFNVKTGVWT